VGDPVTNPYERLTGTPMGGSTPAPAQGGTVIQSTNDSITPMIASSGGTTSESYRSESSEVVARGSVGSNPEMEQYLDNWATDMTGIDSSGRVVPGAGGYDADASISRHADAGGTISQGRGDLAEFRQSNATDLPFTGLTPQHHGDGGASQHHVGSAQPQPMMDPAKAGLDPNAFAINKGQATPAVPPVVVPTAEVRQYLVDRLNKSVRPNAAGPGGASGAGPGGPGSRKDAGKPGVKQPAGAAAKPGATGAPPVKSGGAATGQPKAPVSDWTNHLAIETLKRRARNVQKRGEAEEQSDLEALKKMQKPDDGGWTV
jgi:hypothetical protein